MENQRNRLVEQLEFERSKDTKSKLNKWTKAVSDDEDELMKLQAEEKRQMEVWFSLSNVMSTGWCNNVSFF